MSVTPTVSSLDYVSRALGHLPAKTPTPLEVARANCRLAKLPVEPVPGGHRVDDKGRAARGTAHLLEAIAQPFTEADAIALLRSLPGVIAVEFVSRDALRPDGRWIKSYRAQATDSTHTAHFGNGFTPLEAATACEMNYRLGEPSRREDVPDASELRREVYRDDGDATGGTLPIVSVGHGPIGSDTQQEI